MQRPKGETIHKKTEKKHCILVVEDNNELRWLLKTLFEKKYVIYEAANGQQALDIALEKMPDLIISDVTMPIMTGVELCHHIKGRFETRHIPFIILSARDTLEFQLQGLESGADYYFAKPVSLDLLQLTVNNVFRQKESLKTKYIKDYYADATELTQSTLDRQFLEKLNNLIGENIHSPNLDVDFLCKNMFVSRTKLYQKINGITGQSIGEFIRTVRLKKAADIMTHENVVQNEILDRIGIQSASYFQKSFKKEFGKSPSQFMKDLKKSGT